VKNTANQTSTLVDAPQMAEGFLPKLTIACLHLNSSSIVDLHSMQTVFAHVYLFNHAKVLPFPILRKNSILDLTPQAKSYLHGK
jgi:hypothetical protein